MIMTGPGVDANSGWQKALDDHKRITALTKSIAEQADRMAAEGAEGLNEAVRKNVCELLRLLPPHFEEEEGADGERRRYLQLQLPDIPILSDIVVHVAQEGGAVERDLRLDNLGSAALDLPPGLYRIGLAYAPEDEPAA